ncbi:MAG: hypothetical protein Q8Q10_04395 [bacterium]|nr:hypothetical protein [bacterium]
MRDETDEREREEAKRDVQAERAKKIRQLGSDILVLQSSKKSIESRQNIVKEEIHRLKAEISLDQKALEAEMRRRKIILDRLTVNLEKEEAERNPLEQELARIETEIEHAEREKNDL